MKKKDLMPGMFALALALTAGCGRDPAADASKPWIRHASGSWISNPAYARRLLPDGQWVELPPQRLPAKKPDGGLRVGVFGGAAASGGPASYLNLARGIAAVLEGSMSNRVTEVADLSMPGLAADEVAGLIRLSTDALKLDLVVLYPDPAHCGATVTGGVSRISAKEPMTSWITAARAGGARVVLCIPGANLVDFAPLKSDDSPALQPLLDAAAASDWPKVLETAGAVLQQSPGHALASYLKGRAFLMQSDLQAAGAAFMQAVESDRSALRFPPSSYADFEALQAPDVAVVNANAEIGKILPGVFAAPGGNAFETESIPTVAGWAIIAKGAVEAIHRLSGVSAPVAAPDLAAFRRRLGHTDILTLISANRYLQYLSRPGTETQWGHRAAIATRRNAIGQFEQGLNKESSTSTLPDRVREQLAKHPDDLRLREILALHYVALNQPDPALREIEEIQKLHPGGIENRSLKCRLLAQTGRNDAALQEINLIVAEMPEWVPGLALKSQILLAMGKGADVVTLLEGRRKDPKPEVALLSSLATAYGATGRTNDAVAVLGEALALQPMRADLLLAASELAIQRGKVDEALGYLERARRIAPDAPEVDETFAVLFGRMNDFSKAIALLRRAQANAPGRPRTQQLLQEALTLQDKTAKALFEQGNELRKKGDEAGAVGRYRQALVIHPTAPALLETLAFLYATSPNDGVRNGPESLRLARMRIAQMGGNPSPEACATLAAALAETGDFAGAVVHAEKAVGIAATVKGFNATKLQAALEAYRTSTCWRNTP
ncbi:MAG: tetratricopeptide repeat protein [Kiritimatiellia bacterium]